MRHQLLEQVASTSLREEPLEFEIGDTVDVHCRILEGNKERIQIFSGVVIARKGGGVSETFTVMQQGGHSVVLTVDEFGGIAGLATLKQMMAVIVGQLGEEGVAPEEAVTALGRDAFLIDASLAISDINEELDLDIPEGDYQTLAGFILDRLGSIPELGDVMEFEDLRITIKAMERVKIEEVELRRLHTDIGTDIGSSSANTRSGARQ